jgi:hypothetical protein
MVGRIIKSVCTAFSRRKFLIFGVKDPAEAK